MTYLGLIQEIVREKFQVQFLKKAGEKTFTIKGDTDLIPVNLVTKIVTDCDFFCEQTTTVHIIIWTTHNWAGYVNCHGFEFCFNIYFIQNFIWFHILKILLYEFPKIYCLQSNVENYTDMTFTFSYQRTVFY